MKTPTLLILGAGASAPYGFPLGKELYSWCLGQLPPQALPTYTPLYNHLLDHFSGREIVRFRHDLNASRRNSIDIFAEHRQEYREISKHCIAYRLLSGETASLNEFDNASLDGDWYRLLFNALFNTAASDLDPTGFMVATFNYDRSLEHYLYASLIAAYGMTPEIAKGILKKVPIVHLYGSLGPLEWQGNGDHILYGQPIGQFDAGTRAAASIRIMAEGEKDSAEFQQLRDLLRVAKRVYFLGFSYQTINLDRILHSNGDPQLAPGTVGRRVIGTAVGMGKAETRGARQAKIACHPMDALTLLREVAPLD